VVRGLHLFALIALAACIGPFGFASAANEQQPASPRRIGVILVAMSSENPLAQRFRQGLLEAGYFEGRDVVIEWRSANGEYARVPELVVDLLQQKVDVIVVETTPAVQAVKRASSTIPIVMTIVSDPVGSGVVASLARPGGNVTGFSTMVTDLTAKRLQLLKETMPRLSRVAVLSNPDSTSHPKVIEELKLVAPSLGIELYFVSARAPQEFSAAFSAVTRARAQVLYVIDDAFFAKNRKPILTFAAERRLPIFGDKGFAEGALICYGADFGDLYYRAAGYVDKILKGAKPSELPIEQPTKFELLVNLKTARALGITIPESILLRADEVIR